MVLWSTVVITVATKTMSSKVCLPKYFPALDVYEWGPSRGCSLILLQFPLPIWKTSELLDWCSKILQAYFSRLFEWNFSDFSRTIPSRILTCTHWHRWNHSVVLLQKNWLRFCALNTCSNCLNIEWLNSSIKHISCIEKLLLNFNI